MSRWFEPFFCRRNLNLDNIHKKTQLCISLREAPLNFKLLFHVAFPFFRPTCLLPLAACVKITGTGVRIQYAWGNRYYNNKKRGGEKYQGISRPRPREGKPLHEIQARLPGEQLTSGVAAERVENTEKGGGGGDPLQST